MPGVAQSFHPLRFRDLTGLARRSARFIRFDPYREELRNPKKGLDLVFMVDTLRRGELYQELLNSPEALVFVGSRDLTIPNQIDARAPASVVKESQFLNETSLKQKSLFCENLDDSSSHFSAIPGGVLPRPIKSTYRFVKGGSFKKLNKDRQLVIVSHRHRDGMQWRKRKTVSQLATGPWSEFCWNLDESVRFGTWKRLVRGFSFGTCVAGGGLTPSPKFFELLLLRVIPIIEHSPLSEIHEQFPCVVVPGWQKDALSREFLESEYQRLVSLWKSWDHVLNRLSAAQWDKFLVSRGDVNVLAD